MADYFITPIFWTFFVTDALSKTIGYKGQKISLNFGQQSSFLTDNLTLNAAVLAANCH